jgi:hypothetical protein
MPACIEQRYEGETYPPTDSVRVFASRADVPPGYETIGVGQAIAKQVFDTELIVADIVKKAKKVGADAIVITGIDVFEVAETSRTTSLRQDDLGYFASLDGRLYRQRSSTSRWNRVPYEPRLRETQEVERDKIITVEYLRKIEPKEE